MDLGAFSSNATSKYPDIVYSLRALLQKESACKGESDGSRRSSALALLADKEG